MRVSDFPQYVTVEEMLAPLSAEQQMRVRVIAEALTWLGTPYAPRQRVKGAGCDCFTWIAETLLACGVMEKIDLPFYKRDWFCHTDKEHYMALLMRFATRLPSTIARQGESVESGNIILTCVGDSKVMDHGAIVTKWPRVIHSVDPRVVEVNATKNWMWAGREIAIFDPYKGAL